MNTCGLHLFRLLKCAVCSTIPVKMLQIGQFEKFFLKFIKFQSQLKKKSIYGHLFRSRIVRHTVGKVNIICPSEGADR